MLTDQRTLSQKTKAIWKKLKWSLQSLYPSNFSLSGSLLLEREKVHENCCSFINSRCISRYFKTFQKDNFNSHCRFTHTSCFCMYEMITFELNYRWKWECIFSFLYWLLPQGFDALERCYWQLSKTIRT